MQFHPFKAEQGGVLLHAGTHTNCVDQQVLGASAAAPHKLVLLAQHGTAANGNDERGHGQLQCNLAKVLIVVVSPNFIIDQHHCEPLEGVFMRPRALETTWVPVSRKALARA
eukprot:CAMPEP_0171098786 /NCGR_PEP_ID=MMETSP0766_2-20121228/49533_1 /TAXON_ID=439317 /ORGANISM="Gambierdiscus australes, Strain CAWD 149" /LENGTH=111 /DNA_ID=CAMNT_0011558239 /DNA_START=128 /DNA_END=463 /DNA_ORIENTATION=+